MDLEEEFDRTVEEMETTEMIEVAWAVLQELWINLTGAPLHQSNPAEEWLHPPHTFYRLGPSERSTQGAAPLDLHQLPSTVHCNERAHPVHYDKPQHQQWYLWQQQQQERFLMAESQSRFEPIHSHDMEVDPAPGGASEENVTSEASGENSPSDARTTRRKKRELTHEEEDELPYVKKPPNAFMIFRQEQRPLVVAQLKTANCAAVNSIIGKRWAELSEPEQDHYHNEAEKLMKTHMEVHPEWSARNNYGQKKKRVRTKASASTEGSDSPDDE